MPERYLGQTLGKYRIESLLGSGGFAWVFKGYDPELDIPVAIKVLKPQFAGEQGVVDRFKREASTAARLRHPNIIKIYAVGREGDGVYFVMDYLPSGLSDRLETTESLPEDYVLRVAVDVARALGFAHREGVIHRDIKVDNILFDNHGNAVVADFGIARAVSGYTNQTGTNMVVGTPQYFAPEQARAKPLDGRADIYSLGVTMFRAATGRLPFEGEDWYEIARQHVEEPPPSPRSINPALSPEFENLVLRCLAKSPEDRPATAEQLVDEMLDVLNVRRDVSGASTVTVPTTPGATPPSVRLSRQPTRPAPKRTLVPAAIVATLVVAGLAAVLSWPINGATLTNGAPPDSLPPVTVQESASVAVTDSQADPVNRPPNQKSPLATRPTRPTGSQLGSLVVRAPVGSTVTMDGGYAGVGGMTRDTLPGVYIVRAEVPSIEGCPTALDVDTVRVESGRSTTVEMNPVACGTLMFLAAGLRNAGTRNEEQVPGVIWYTLESESGRRLPEGQLPLRQPIVLPAGKWTLRLRLNSCVPYTEPAFELKPGEHKILATIAILC